MLPRFASRVVPLTKGFGQSVASLSPAVSATASSVLQDRDFANQKTPPYVHSLVDHVAEKLPSSSLTGVYAPQDGGETSHARKTYGNRPLSHVFTSADPSMQDVSGDAQSSGAPGTSSPVDNGPFHAVVPTQTTPVHDESVAASADPLEEGDLTLPPEGIDKKHYDLFFWKHAPAPTRNYAIPQRPLLLEHQEFVNELVEGNNFLLENVPGYTVTELGEFGTVKKDAETKTTLLGLLGMSDREVDQNIKALLAYLSDPGNLPVVLHCLQIWLASLGGGMRSFLPMNPQEGAELLKAILSRERLGITANACAAMLVNAHGLASAFGDASSSNAQTPASVITRANMFLKDLKDMDSYARRLYVGELMSKFFDNDHKAEEGDQLPDYEALMVTAVEKDFETRLADVTNASDAVAVEGKIIALEKERESRIAQVRQIFKNHRKYYAACVSNLVGNFAGEGSLEQKESQAKDIIANAVETLLYSMHDSEPRLQKKVSLQRITQNETPEERISEHWKNAMNKHAEATKVLRQYWKGDKQQKTQQDPQDNENERLDKLLRKLQGKTIEKQAHQMKREAEQRDEVETYEGDVSHLRPEIGDGTHMHGRHHEDV